MYTLLIILLIALVLGLDWLITCGIFKLICLCFGWTFTWPIATGVWLIVTLVEVALKTIIGGKNYGN